MIANTPERHRGSRGSNRFRWAVAGLAVALLITMAPPTALAGTMSVAWDPVADVDLAGYRVFVGTAPGSSDIAVLDVGNVTSVDLLGLPDCAALHLAVKAVDFSGNQSASFSNDLEGMTQPSVNSISPAQFQQGTENVTVRLVGGSFSSQMGLDDVVFNHEEIRVHDVNWLSCNSLDVTISVGPFVSNPGDPGYNGDGNAVELVDPAEKGTYPVFTAAPDSLGERILGGPSCAEQNVTDCSASTVLEVEWLTERTDADLSGRVDGYDLARLARALGSRRCTLAEAAAGDCDPNVTPLYDATVDLNGDKQVDGLDIGFFADFFGAAF